MAVRDDVLKALEEKRNEKVIGKPLEASITIEPKDDYTKEVLTTIPHVHQLLIVSEAKIGEVSDAGREYNYVNIEVEKHSGEKCSRCWVMSHSVGDNEKHPELCNRCGDIVEEHYSHLFE